MYKILLSAFAIGTAYAADDCPNYGLLNPAEQFNSVESAKSWILHIDEAFKWRRENNYNISAFPPLSTLMNSEAFTFFTDTLAKDFATQKPNTRENFENLLFKNIGTTFDAHPFTTINRLAIIESLRGYTDLYLDLTPDNIKAFRLKPGPLVEQISEDTIKLPCVKTMNNFLSRISFQMYEDALQKNKETFFSAFTNEHSYSFVLDMSDRTFSRATFQCHLLVLFLTDPFMKQVLSPFITITSSGGTTNE